MTRAPATAPGGAEDPDGSLSAAARAVASAVATRDDPAGRLDLIKQTYLGPYGHAPKHLPFRRAALSFMSWQLRRGLLAPPTVKPPGSPWWRAVNERLLRDQCEAVARSGGLGGDPSAPTIELWMTFISKPTARNWYRAHNASIVAAYVEHQDLAAQENEAGRFFLNVVLLRVLYARTRWWRVAADSGGGSGLRLAVRGAPGLAPDAPLPRGAVASLRHPTPPG